MKFLLLICSFAAVAAQCPPGLNPVPSASQPSVCSPQDLCSCQTQRAGSTCQYSQQYSRYICCAAQAQQCGSTSSPLLSSTGQTVQCQSSNDCSSGFTCTQGICCASGTNPACSSSMCGNGQVYVNGQCMSTVPIGSMCQVTQQCRGGSACVNSRCQCPNGATVNSNGECSNNSGNSCQLGTVMVNGQCVSLASPGMSCVAQEQCIDNSVCMGNICNCNQGYSLIAGYCIRYTGGPCQQTQTLVNGQCVTYSVVNGPCMADAQCVGGSTCQNSVCSCKTGYIAMYGFCIRDNSNTQQCGVSQVYVNGQCIPGVQIGGPCSNTQQCLGNSNCVNNYCQCRNGATALYGKCSSPECGQNQIYVNTQCYPLVMVGSSCNLNEQCTGSSQCTNGYCQCPNGGTPSNGMCATQSTSCKGYQVAINNQCLDKVSIGQSCSNYAQCPANAVCSSTCQCSYPYSYNGTACVSGIYLCSQGSVSVSGRCLNLVQLGQSCTYSEQCMGFGSCTSSVCSCRAGSSAINGVCRSAAELIGCGTNQVLIQNQCYPVVQIGGRCTYSQQCGGGSSCLSNVCQCPSNTFNYGDGYCRSGGSGGTSPTGQCSNPSETVAYQNGAAINCLFSHCPTNSHCEYSNSMQQYVCCG